MAKDHFVVNYQPNRVDWNFNVTFDDQPQIADMAEKFAPFVDTRYYYDPIPPEWLHSTILRAGIVRDFTESEMLSVANTVETKLASNPMPQFIVDSWTVSGGIEMAFSPKDSYRKLFEVVAQSLVDICGEERAIKKPDGYFKAHMSLAYSKEHDQEIVVNKSLQNAQNVTLPEFRATTLDLIRQWPANGHYEWEVVKRIHIPQK